MSECLMFETPKLILIRFGIGVYIISCQKVGPSHHGVVHPWVVDGGGGPQIWRVAAFEDS
jgi:hypothetical protein